MITSLVLLWGLYFILRVHAGLSAVHRSRILWKPCESVATILAKQLTQAEIRLHRRYVSSFICWCFRVSYLEMGRCLESGVLPWMLLEDLCVHLYFLSKIWEVLNPKICVGLLGMEAYGPQYWMYFWMELGGKIPYDLTWCEGAMVMNVCTP